METPGAAVVRFRDAGGDIVGHGALVDEEHVVTCAHVVNAALGRDLTDTASAEGEALRLEFPLLAQLHAQAPERWARVDAWRPPGSAFDGVDVAGLTLVGEARPVGALPIPLAQEDRTSGDVMLFGPVEGRPGGWVPGRLRPAVTRYRQQIDQETRGEHAVQERYSGTPVLDPRAERVLGILVASAYTPGDGPGDRDVYAVPVSVLVDAWPTAFAPLPASPYKGLEAFDQQDRALFFGREKMTAELVEAVRGRRLVPVVGASGAGKTSLVQAGLLPRLAAEQTAWRFAVVRPRPTLAAALAAGLARAAGAPHPVPLSELEAWQSRIASDGLAGAGDLVLAATGGERLLLVVDQLEEALDGSPGTARVLEQLADLAHAEHSSTRAVLTLREDAFGELFVRPGRFGEVLRDTAVALRAMAREELSEAILEPARGRGLDVHEHLADRLASLVEGHPGALPLLEFTLDRMWGTLRRGQDTLSFEAYAEIGELRGALAEYADGVLAGLADEERALVRGLFVNHLTAPEQSDLRRVARRSELLPAQWAIAVRLANERLLTTARSAEGEETVEVVHEALLREWGTLTAWLKEEEPFRNWRRILAYAMRPPEAAGAPAAVLTGALLADSERWLAERAADITAAERRFVAASRERQDREERRYRVLFEESMARSLTEAAVRAEGNPRVALLLAVEALERSESYEADHLVRRCLRLSGAEAHEYVPAAGHASELVRIANRLRLRQWAAGPRTQWRHSVQDFDRWTLGNDSISVLVDYVGAVQVHWGTSDTRTPLPLPAPAVLAACTDAASMLCLGTEVGELFLYQITDSVEEMWRVRLPCPATCVAVDAAGSMVAAGCDDGVTRVLSAQGGGRELLELSSPGFVEDLDFRRDGLALAAQSGGSRIRVWDLPWGELRHLLTTTLGLISFSADGEHLLRQEPRFEESGTLARLPLGVRRLSECARRAAGPPLTDDEWGTYVGASPLTRDAAAHAGFGAPVSGDSPPAP
ncbi:MULTISPECIES: AAA family ATPase [unclassified Streptomyces]|uniref:nSTAND1 domain-containing NTPase n=1 Tax=unclassified Streptomyces TaxID=2593676 RepID=UPI00278C6FCE|nr:MULTISPECIES: AAA family ATPase [unclassified Streptomyces]